MGGKCRRDLAAVPARAGRMTEAYSADIKAVSGSAA